MSRYYGKDFGILFGGNAPFKGYEFISIRLIKKNRMIPSLLASDASIKSNKWKSNVFIDFLSKRLRNWFKFNYFHLLLLIEASAVNKLGIIPFDETNRSNSEVQPYFEQIKMYLYYLINSHKYPEIFAAQSSCWTSIRCWQCQDSAACRWLHSARCRYSCFLRRPPVRLWSTL